MKYDPNKHHRKSIRLKGYDYTQLGAYFVTMVTRHRECLFGDILNGKVHLNQTGKIIKRIWLSIPANFPNSALDEFIFMPNHLHGIIWIMDSRTPEGNSTRLIKRDYPKFQIHRHPKNQPDSQHPRQQNLAARLL